MDELNDLKAAILWAEREAHWREKVAEQRSPGLRTAISAEAERYRIAAACMWEKLERMEEEQAPALGGGRWECEKCIHKPVCDEWHEQESMAACSYGDYFQEAGQC